MHLKRESLFVKFILNRGQRFSPFFLDGYCSIVQGLLDWFEVDWRFTKFVFIQIDLCVLLRGGSASRVSAQSCQSHESLWGWWYPLRCFRVTTTCSIGYDRPRASSIHRSPYHILKSTWSTTRSVSLPMPLVSPSLLSRTRWDKSHPLPAYPLLCWFFLGSFSKRDWCRSSVVWIAWQCV